MAVAGKVLAWLQTLNNDNWETTFCQIIGEISGNHEMDPILKANLLEKVIEGRRPRKLLPGAGV